MVVVAAPRSQVRNWLLSAVAAPLFAAGWIAQTVAVGALWCGAAVMLGVDSARERWKRAG